MEYYYLRIFLEERKKGRNSNFAKSLFSFVVETNLLKCLTKHIGQDIQKCKTIKRTYIKRYYKTAEPVRQRKSVYNKHDEKHLWAKKIQVYLTEGPSDLTGKIVILGLLFLTAHLFYFCLSPLQFFAFSMRMFRFLIYSYTTY